MTDVENWQLSRENRIIKHPNQTLLVKPSVAKPAETLIMLSDKGKATVLARLTVEELDALIVLLRYRRSLIDDIPDPKEAT